MLLYRQILYECVYYVYYVTLSCLCIYTLVTYSIFWIIRDLNRTSATNDLRVEKFRLFFHFGDVSIFSFSHSRFQILAAGTRSA